MRQLRSRRPGRRVDLVGVTKTGPDRQERVAALGAQPLAVALLALAKRGRDALPVARAHVVHDDVAGDMVHRLGGRDAAGLLRR